MKKQRPNEHKMRNTHQAFEIYIRHVRMYHKYLEG